MAVVLGYHGCDQRTARLLLGGSPFVESNQRYDWLGPGFYLWQDDPERAYQWAMERRASSPCVVGVVVDLGNCLDLTTQRGVSLVAKAHAAFVALQQKNGRPVPVNKDASGTKPGDLVLRYLDRAVIEHLHSTFRRQASKSPGIVSDFATVRAMFPEGDPIYPGAGFLRKTHVQVAVRKPEQVLGVFRVPAWQLARLQLPDVYKGI